jgi:hypothetical protein
MVSGVRHVPAPEGGTRSGSGRGTGHAHTHTLSLSLGFTSVCRDSSSCTRSSSSSKAWDLSTESLPRSCARITRVRCPLPSPRSCARSWPGSETRKLFNSCSIKLCILPQRFAVGLGSATENTCPLEVEAGVLAVLMFVCLTPLCNVGHVACHLHLVPICGVALPVRVPLLQTSQSE